jgi:hypothetical protein
MGSLYSGRDIALFGRPQAGVEFLRLDEPPLGFE